MKKKGIFNITKIEPVEKLPEPIIQTEISTSTEYWPFGVDNLFPQTLMKLILRTPILSGCIESKKDYTIGNGVTSQDKATNNWIIETKFNKDLERAIYDHLGIGNAFMLISWNKLTQRIYHVDATTCRLGVNKNAGLVLIHPDWRQYSNFGKSKDLLQKIPIWPNYTKINGDNHSIIQLKEYTPTYSQYGVAKYITALKAAQVNYKSDIWNVNKIDNQFQPGAIFSAPFASLEQANQFQTEINDKKGALANGELLVVAKGMGGNQVEFTPVQSQNDGEWLDVRKFSQDDIITANTWFGVLLGQSTPGKLGQSQEIRNTFVLAMNTVIKPERRTFIDEIINEIFPYFGLNPDIQFNDITPFDYSDKIDINKLVTIEEAYRLLGLQINLNRTDLNEKLNGSTDNSFGSSNTGK